MCEGPSGASDVSPQKLVSRRISADPSLIQFYDLNNMRSITSFASPKTVNRHVGSGEVVAEIVVVVVVVVEFIH